MKRALLVACLATLCGASYAAAIDTTDAGTVSAFQSGLTVVDFESIATRTPFAVTSYSAGTPVDESAFVFNQLSGVQFSVGGVVGTNRPALFQLGGGIAGDAHSGNTVLGPVDFDGTTKFDGFIEIFFPQKVSRVGFWLNPSLGNVRLIAADTNFAFSGQNENVLEFSDGTAGHFVGIERPTADIGGFKILLTQGSTGFTVDDFSYGVAAAVPEPSTWATLVAGLGALGFGLRRSQRT